MVFHRVAWPLTLSLSPLRGAREPGSTALVRGAGETGSAALVLRAGKAGSTGHAGRPDRHLELNRRRFFCARLSRFREGAASLPRRIAAAARRLRPRSRDRRDAGSARHLGSLSPWERARVRVLTPRPPISCALRHSLTCSPSARSTPTGWVRVARWRVRAWRKLRTPGPGRSGMGRRGGSRYGSPRVDGPPHPVTP
jgi:hypothetical protein